CTGRCRQHLRKAVRLLTRQQAQGITNNGGGAARPAAEAVERPRKKKEAKKNLRLSATPGGGEQSGFPIVLGIVRCRILLAALEPRHDGWNLRNDKGNLEQAPACDIFVLPFPETLECLIHEAPSC